jgi:hypothetical protein
MVKPMKRRREKNKKILVFFKSIYKIGVVIFGIAVAIPVVYLLFFRTSGEDGEEGFAFRWPFAPRDIPIHQLRYAFTKFPDTILAVRSVRDKVKREGYTLADTVIDSVTISAICSASPPPKREPEPGKVDDNCLEIGLLSNSLEKLKKLDPKTKIKWLKAIYSFEYERSYLGFTIDGVFDKKEIKLLSNRVIKKIDKQFLEKTQPALIELVRDMQKNDISLQDSLIYNALQGFLGASGAGEGVIGGEWPKDATPERNRKTIARWIEGIYRFQKSNKLSFPRVNYGVIRDPDDPTYEELLKTVINSFTVPRPVLLSARRQFDITRQGIERITRSVHDRLLGDPSLEKGLEIRYIGIIRERDAGTGEMNFNLEEDIKSRLSKVLGVRDKSLDIDLDPTVYESTILKENRWIAAIYRYQKYSLGLRNPTGILTGNDEASQRINKAIGAQLKEELIYY